jgi:hypothetical protein
VINKRHIKPWEIVLSITVLIITAVPILRASDSTTSGAFIVVFVDFSASTKADRQIYIDALTKVRQSLAPGDRILIDRIGASTLTGFSPIIDVALNQVPRKTWWENPITYENHRNNIVKRDNILLTTEWAKVDDALRGRAIAQRSCILSAFKVAAEALAGDMPAHAHKVILVLSDMLEDCENLDFERRIPDGAETAEKVVQRQTQAGELPNLHDVRIYVTGASAASTEAFEAIENFWLTYFSACHAVSTHANYGHYLLNFSLHDQETPETPSSPPTPFESTAVEASSACHQMWGLGSTKTMVLNALGDPTNYSNGPGNSEYWRYGQRSFVRFDSSGKVIEFFNGGNFRTCH